MPNLSISHLFSVSLGLLILLAGCGSGQIKDLQSSVNKLENRVQSYQQETNRDTNQAASSLGEMNRTLSDAFKDIKYSQSNLETMMNTLSNRVSKLETDVAGLNQRMGRLDSFTNESVNFSQDLKKNAETTQEQTQKALQALQNEIQSVKQAGSTLESSVRAQSKRMDSIESGNQEVYRKILKQLGAGETKSAEPKNSETKNNSAEGYSGKVHTVNPGETLSKIAAKYGVTAKEITDLNGLPDNVKVKSGQKIKIP